MASSETIIISFLPSFIEVIKKLGGRIIRKIKKEKVKKESEKEKKETEDENIESVDVNITIEWENLEKVAEDLSIIINRDFRTELIFIPDTQLGTIAHMLKLHLSNESSLIPIVVGTRICKNGNVKQEIPANLKSLYSASLKFLYFACDTTKWYAFIPKQITKCKKKNILIIDDMTITGTYGTEIKKWLFKKGFNKNKVKTASIIVSTAAFVDHQQPDYYLKKTTANKFIFPWGPSR